MLYLKSMSPQSFEKFKKNSQESYAESLALCEDIPVAEALKNASVQFSQLVQSGASTPGQYFFDVIEAATEKVVGFLWLSIQNRFGRKVASINDISINESDRGKGFGKELMKLVENEARQLGATRVRLHVFNHNEVAKKLYLAMGFVPTNIDMRKDLN
jgi:ribosomal protein S18 acetylase RimI-like enzyme